jgi:GAF domain-containing protein
MADDGPGDRMTGDRCGDRGDAADPAAVFAGLARIVYAPDSLDEVLGALCDSAPRLVPGCHHASVMLVRDGRFLTAAASDDIGRRIDATEREIGEGPCLDAIVDEAGQIDADLTDRSSWPRLADWVLTNTPVRGVAGYRLIVDGAKVGALNLYSDTPGALSRSADQAAVLAAFASVAMIATSRHQLVADLRAGLHSNREIGKAVGLLMAHHKVSDEDAFALLRKASQDMNIKLARVAREVVDHHNQR